MPGLPGMVLCNLLLCNLLQCHVINVSAILCILMQCRSTILQYVCEMSVHYAYICIFVMSLLHCMQCYAVLVQYAAVLVQCFCSVTIMFFGDNTMLKQC